MEAVEPLNSVRLQPGPGKSGRDEWEDDLREHRSMLRKLTSDHRDARSHGLFIDDERDEQLVLREEEVYLPIAALYSRVPPDIVQGESGRIYHSLSFGFLQPKHPLRRFAIDTVEAPLFDPFILITIFVNCLAMAVASPLDEPGTDKQAMLDFLEPLFLYIFTFEMISKMIAYGLVMHEHSYLRDAWCQLDFVVVTLAWLPVIFPGFANMSAIRSVRALRPLRALKRVPGMPVLVSSILKAMPALANVAGVAFFLFMVFAIIGVEFFKGVLHYRCADPELMDMADTSEAAITTSLAGAPSAAITTSLASAPSAAINASMHRLLRGGGSAPSDEADTGKLCHPNGYVDACAPHGHVCFDFGTNPGGGTISFDSVPAAMLPIMQALTFDVWTEPMFDTMDAFSYSAWIYFVSAVIFGGFFIVNLFLAVISEEFMKAKATDEAEKEVTAGLNRRIRYPEYHVDESALSALIKKNKARIEHENCLICDCTPKSQGCCSWRMRLSIVMNSETVSNISTGLVVINIVVMCMPYASQPEWWERLTDTLSEVITWAFIIEMGLKTLGMGCRAYWSDSWNVLDGIIVLLSIGEIAITIWLADTGINISFLRMLRLARLLKLLRAWPGLYKVVMAFVAALPQIANLFVLMFLMMSIFSLLGMQTFGGTGLSADSRWHFDYFYNAMLTSFAIFTGTWVDVFEACSEIVGVGTSVAFFMPCVIVGFFVIMNLFIGILLDAFGEAEDEEQDEQEKEKQKEPAAEAEAQKETHTQERKPDGRPASPAPIEVLNRVHPEDATVDGPTELVDITFGCLTPENKVRRFCHYVATHPIYDAFIIATILISSICLALDVPRLDPASDLKTMLTVMNYCFTAIFIMEMFLKVVAQGFICTTDAYLKSPWNILDFCIVLISILSLLAGLVPAFGQLKSLRILRVLRPLRLLRRDPGMRTIISSLIKTLPSVFEVLAVVVTFHLVFAITGMMLFSGKFGACTDESITVRSECVPQVERRALLESATIRVPSLHKEPHGVVKLLTGEPQHSSNGTISPPLPSTAIPSPPPVDGVGDEKRRSITRGKALNARRREMGNGAHRNLAERRRARKLKGGGGGEANNDDLPVEWLNPPFGSFDDFQSSMLILFVASTGDAWEEFMFAGMDATSVDVAPVRNDSSAASLFFLLWMVIGNFVALNLFVGTIVDNFTRCQGEENGSATMTREQQQWVAAMKATTTAPAKAMRDPSFTPRLHAFRLVCSREWDLFVFYVIALNIMWMALDYDGIEKSGWFFSTYSVGLDMFTNFFYIEFIIKFFAMGWFYFKDGWSRFDFFLVVVSAADDFFEDGVLPISATTLRVLRTARVLRIVRLLKNLKGLRDLVMTLVFAFPSLMNVSALLGIVIFMYAVLGMNLFAYVQHGENLNEDRNFESFGNACLALFQSLTGDGWSDIMDDLLIDEKRGCDPSPEIGPSDCGSILSLPFFISFVVVGTFVFLNLIVAVILDNFTTIGSSNPDLVSAMDISDFKEAWGYYDPDADGIIPAKDLPELLLNLKAPLGLKNTTIIAGSNPRSKALRYCIGLDLRQTDGGIQFKKTLDALIAKNYESKQVSILPEPPGGDSPINKRVYTPRRREIASVYSEEIIGTFIKHKHDDTNGSSLHSNGPASPALSPEYREELKKAYRKGGIFSKEVMLKREAIAIEEEEAAAAAAAAAAQEAAEAAKKAAAEQKMSQKPHLPRHLRSPPKASPPVAEAAAPPPEVNFVKRADEFLLKPKSAAMDQKPPGVPKSSRKVRIQSESARSVRVDTRTLATSPSRARTNGRPSPSKPRQVNPASRPGMPSTAGHSALPSPARPPPPPDKVGGLSQS